MTLSAAAPVLRVAVFDLDGTLVDSLDGIVHSLQQALDKCGQTPARPVTRALIGPPLRRLLEILLPDADAACCDQVAAAFAADYDTEGVIRTPVYPGIEGYLRALRQQGVHLFILTNKRSVPTRRLLAHLGWETWFSGIDATELGAFQAAKGARLARLLAACSARLQAAGEAPLRTAECLMIGDSLDDLEAAQENGTAFAAATWGYGNISEQAARLDCRLAAHPGELPLSLHG